MRDNKLRHLPEKFGNLDKLEDLFLQGNKIEWLPPSMANCVELFQEKKIPLKLAANPLSKPIVKAMVDGHLPGLQKLLQSYVLFMIVSSEV